MFDRSGDSGPPCGVPSSLSIMHPLVIIPLLRYTYISLLMSLSSSVRSTRLIRRSWLTVSKNLDRSRSTTYLYPSAMYSCAFLTASSALRPGLNP